MKAGVWVHGSRAYRPHRTEVSLNEAEMTVLAKIDEAVFAADLASSQAQLNQAKAQVGISKANRSLAQARQEQARRDWERAQKLGNTAALSKAVREKV